MEDLGLRRIAVLGATSSIFKALLADKSFVNEDDYFDLFSRHETPETVIEVKAQIFTHPLSEFAASQVEFDEIFNFIGTGNPQISNIDLGLLQEASLYWDSIALKMLEKKQAKRYFSMSSGIADEIYDSGAANPYRDLKVEIEKRHGDANLPICDIRIFGFADARGRFFPGSLVGDIRHAISSRKPLVTDSSDPLRDYCGAKEMASLLSALRTNDVFRGISELHSLEPVRKMELLDLLGQLGLLSVSRSAEALITSTGPKPEYAPRNIDNVIGYKPERKSIEVVCSALGVVL